MKVRDLLEACRVPTALAPRDSGLWHIRRREFPAGMIEYVRDNKLMMGPWHSYTLLGRWTDATLHQGFGDVVMEDSWRELARHLPILLAARGRVLVSGLGLGCVVRGLLAKREVAHVDVVEIDWNILEMVGPEFAPNPRVTLHHGDALTYPWPPHARWDYAWHDCWLEGNGLDLLHIKLFGRFRNRVGRQGAWGMARWAKRVWPDPVLGGERKHNRIKEAS